ncbi:hypothetical protein LWI29_031881 [Acer saccharum]|uniref:Tify domain-containing protein n=1 Tax=Acer saccharum TaxID=4024 RepID=A0AA39VSC4_ACESA|nr:hypothetical protein LWI29_031881 [Acer saccharum]
MSGRRFMMKTEDCCSDDQEKAGGLRQANNYDMAQTICMFRKYLLAKTHHYNVGKSNMEESQQLKRHIITTTIPSAPFIPPKFSSNLARPPTLLEQELLPGMRYDETESKSTNAKSSREELTIFYAGTVNVYSNVPHDKACNRAEVGDENERLEMMKEIENL